jgi:beta-barrel assembly-enhancing protease
MRGVTGLLAALVCSVSWAATPQPAASPISLSDTDEIRIGHLLADKFASAEGMLPTPQTRKIDAYLQLVGDRLTANAKRKIPYQFHFDPSPGFRSAVGLPGGQIFVGAGILAYMDSEDQLAIVLGHEIEHVDLNQCHDRLIKVLGDQHLSPRDAGRLRVDPFLDGYGHDKEFAADREGVLLARKAGYSATGAAIRLLQTFVILGEQMTHAPNEAKANLEARIAQIQALEDPEKPKPPEETPFKLLP